MSFVSDSRVFLPDQQWITFSKEIGTQISFSCHVLCKTTHFLEFQKDLFDDFLSTVVEILEQEETTFEQCKKKFEHALQDLNSKLGIFAAKIKDTPRFELSGVAQIVYEGEYIASLIGSVGVAIVRDGKVTYVLSNQSPEQSKIDLFSEFIEGELREEDEVIMMGIHLDTYMDKHDLQTALHMRTTEQVPLHDALLELLQTRMQPEQIGFLVISTIQSAQRFSQKKVKKHFSHHIQRLHGIFAYLKTFKTAAIYTGVGILVLGLLWGVIQSFLSANNVSFVGEQWGVVIDFTIDDIQKDIAIFKKIDPSSDEKIKKYQQIIKQLDMLEESNRWTYDVAELRKILEAEYYKGFNIVLVNNDSLFQDGKYTFTQQEKNTFGEVQRVFYNNGMYVAGKEGVLLGAINETLRGILMSAGIGRTLTTCSLNLLKNGIFCLANDGLLYNANKLGLEPVSTSVGTFPSTIKQLGTFRTSNLYLLVDNPELKANQIYLLRYTNVPGSQNQFGEPTQYPLDASALEALSGFGGGSGASTLPFNAVTIDGTFLTWAPHSKKLIQLWRDGTNPALFARVVPLLGGDTIGDTYSDNVRIMATAESRYVYLFDITNQTFTVYRSTPYKTNDANTTSYQLRYFFRIKMAMPDMKIIDAYVEEGEKSLLHILTAEGVYKIKLYDLISSFAAQDPAAQ